MANKGNALNGTFTELDKTWVREQLLRCPLCRKSMADHVGLSAYRCLRELAEKDLQSLEDSLTKKGMR